MGHVQTFGQPTNQGIRAVTGRFSHLLGALLTIGTNSAAYRTLSLTTTSAIT
jgi:hypothetical protein